MRPIALLSMDVEDWYHLEYFRGGAPASREVSVLDGVRRFRELLDEEGVPGTFFWLGDVAAARAGELRELAASGHEVASHGPDHALLTGRDPAAWAAELARHRDVLEQLLGAPVSGYRAPCFSMDREKLERLPELGFAYDSSWIRFDRHPLYGSMRLDDWAEPVRGARLDPRSRLVELEVTTRRIGRRTIPVAGGAYLRLFPWALTRALLAPRLAEGGVYTFYIHPFECSAVHRVPYPPGTGAATRARFQLGRRRALSRVRRLIGLLREAGFSFSTCSGAVRELAR
jgi:polysaccharide deacetylase family protein (PEP-CTERM system associated)